MDEMNKLSKSFKALGDPTRIQILEYLGGCCRMATLTDSGGISATDGPTAGEVCCQITGAGKINSTISHHLKTLQEAGLISVERQGKNMICCPNPEGFRELVSFLQRFTPGEDQNGCC